MVLRDERTQAPKVGTFDALVSLDLHGDFPGTQNEADFQRGLGPPEVDSVVEFPVRGVRQDLQVQRGVGVFEPLVSCPLAMRRVLAVTRESARIAG
jgi:hypothetical protein